MARRRKTFEYVTETATDDAGLTNLDRLYFHYFNPRGLYAQDQALDAAVSALVEAGKANTGALFVHGSLGDYCYRRVTGMVKVLQDRRGRRPTSSAISVVLAMWRDKIRDGWQFVHQVEAGTRRGQPSFRYDAQPSFKRPRYKVVAIRPTYDGRGALTGSTRTPIAFAATIGWAFELEARAWAARDPGDDETRYGVIDHRGRARSCAWQPRHRGLVAAVAEDDLPF